MKVLFVSATLPPEGTATAGIIGNIMEEMQRKGIIVSGLTFRNSITDAISSEWNGIVVWRARYVREYGYKSNSLADILFKAKRKICDFAYSAKKRPYRELAVDSLMRAMKKMHADDSFDVIIAVAAFYDAIEAVRRFKKNLKETPKAKYIFYQVDPLQENQAFKQIDSAWLESYENDIYTRADHVFTTREIYMAKEQESWKLENVTAVEFPCVNMEMALRSSSLIKNDNEIRCVYAGQLNEQIRDATTALKIFSRIKDERIAFYFIGQGQKELLHRYSEAELCGRIHIMESMPAKQCEEWLLSADVLLIIGNNVTNQVPSKVFSYMSYGLPIVATSKTLDCPSIAYLKEIPNALIIKESDSEDDLNLAAQRIEEFIACKRGTRLSYNEIENYAYKYTAEHIAKIITSTIATLK